MSRFGGNRETLRREDERKFARLLGNAKSATGRALEQIADDWTCGECTLAGIPQNDICPTCNPQSK